MFDSRANRSRRRELPSLGGVPHAPRGGRWPPLRSLCWLLHQRGTKFICQLVNHLEPRGELLLRRFNFPVVQPPRRRAKLFHIGGVHREHLTVGSPPRKFDLLSPQWFARISRQFTVTQECGRRPNLVS